MTKYKSNDFLDDELLNKLNAEIEKQLEEEFENPEKVPPKEESKIGIFGWIMLGILLTMVGFKLGVLILSYMKLIN